jgi:tRNA dimethylallyltransferase
MARVWQQGAPGARRPPALIVAGPTCSGKSALALLLAERFGGTVINADAMQIYRELRVLTARPTPAEEARAPHALYGVRPAALAGSAAWWRQAALAEMARTVAAGRLPILCGGTGLYVSALIEGLSQIPEPGEAARAEARQLLAALGAEALHARLAEADPVTAAQLRPTDSQRVARAWEVWRGTGQGLAAWQAEAALPPAAYDFAAIRLDPPRAELREAIATRFAAMLEDGALAEVQALLALGLSPALPAMRAHGVPELAAFLRGEITLAEAQRRACLATGQYTKRQATWFRHRFPVAPERVHMIHARFAQLEQLSESIGRNLISFVHTWVDAVV